MNANIVGFDVKLGRKKPENIIHKDADCPFCDVDKLTDIIATDGDIILLKNKYNVITDADQFVLIESKECHFDMPYYSKEHMRRLIRFGLFHYERMRKSDKYEAVIFFKNYGPLSGGTIRHPHMQIVGFKKINPDLFCNEEEFNGLLISKNNSIEMNISTAPKIGFGEINIIGDVGYEPDTLADYIQMSTDYMVNHLNRRNKSYNIFFYSINDKLYVKILPRFATSPLFIGYNIRFIPNNVAEIADEIRNLYFEN